MGGVDGGERLAGGFSHPGREHAREHRLALERMAETEPVRVGADQYAVDGTGKGPRHHVPAPAAGGREDLPVEASPHHRGRLDHRALVVAELRQSGRTVSAIDSGMPGDASSSSTNSGMPSE